MIPTPPELYQDYRHRTKKHFGQHFIVNPSILEQIVAHANLRPGDHVLEIGPGCGTLTATLMRARACVTAIEIDRDAADFLDNHLVPHGLRLLRGDALDVDLSEILNGTSSESRWKVVANLPYNVATPLTTYLLAARAFSRLVLMYQREVAERITASPRTSAYGSLTIAVAARAHATIVMPVSKGAFTPPPRVESAVVAFDPKDPTVIPSEEELAWCETIIRHAFQQRRKTIVNSLGHAGFDKEAVRDSLQSLDLNERARAEELSPEKWLHFAQLFVQN